MDPLLLHSIFRHAKSILDVATIQTFHGTVSKRLGNALRKLSNVGMVQEIRKPQISVDNIWIQREEILPNGAQARIFVTERGDKDSWLAAVIELVVDASLR